MHISNYITYTYNFYMDIRKVINHAASIMIIIIKIRVTQEAKPANMLPRGTDTHTHIAYNIYGQ